MELTLLADARCLSLTRREADIALRFAAPRDGGSAVLAERIAAIPFGVFTAAAFEAVPQDERPRLGYHPASAHLPQARWTREYAKTIGDSLSNLLVHDLETAIEIAATVLVRAVLPIMAAASNSRLSRCSEPARAEFLRRDLWLMRHRDTRGLRRIESVRSWLRGAVEAALTPDG